MHAETIDNGARIDVLRAFGPPDVVKVDPFAGDASALIGADNKWTVVKAVTLELVTSADVAARIPRLSWLADEGVPFAQALAPFSIAAAHTSQVTFAVDVHEAGAANGPTIIAPMPELVLLPGWELELDVVAGVAADAIKNVRVYLQRFVLVDVKHLIGG